MFCCFRPPTAQDDAHTAGSANPGVNARAAASSKAAAAPPEPLHPAAASSGKPPPGRRSNSLGSNPLATQQQTAGTPGSPAGLGQIALEPLVKLGEGAALQTAVLPPDMVGAAGNASAAAAAAGTDDDGQGGQQGGVLKLVALLQELLALSTASPRQPLSKAMSLLVVRLPVDWACLHAISNSGRVVMQVRRCGTCSALVVCAPESIHTMIS